MNQKEIRYLCLRVFVAQGDDQYRVRLGELRTALKKSVEGPSNLYLIWKKPKPSVDEASRPKPKILGLRRRAKKATP
jgi:hypothetical protein